MNRSNCLLRMAAVYIVIGVTLGNIMGATMDFTFKSVHVHLNLLGWASMFLIGLWYRVAPASANTKLASAHFWLHSIGFPLQMISLTILMTGNKSVEPVLGLLSMIVGFGILCFAINLWNHTGSSSTS